MSYLQTDYREDTQAQFGQSIEATQHIHDTIPLARSPFITPVWYRRWYRAFLLGVTKLCTQVLGTPLRVHDELFSLRSYSAETRALLLWLTKHGYLEYWNTTMLVPGMPCISLLNLQPTPIKTPNGGLYHLGGATGSGVGRTVNEAAKPALGEFIERYACSSDWWKRSDLCTYSVREMERHGSPIDLQTLNCFSTEQQNEHGFPYTRYQDGMQLSWVRAHDLVRKQYVHVPASAVYMFFSNDNPNEPVFSEVSSNGAAAHTSYTHAVVRGIYELIERDAFLRAWYHRSPGKRISMESLIKTFPEYAPMCALYEKRNIKFAIVDCTSDLNVPTATMILVNKNEGERSVLVSAATDLDPYVVIEKLLLESRRFINGSRGQISEAEDRQIRTTKYGEGCANGYHQRHTLWSHPHMIEHIRWFIDRPEMSVEEFLAQNTMSDCASQIPAKQLQQLRKILRTHEISVYIADVTNDLARHAGLTVVRTISPELVPMYFNERYQPSNINRFTHDADGKIVNLNPIPHPFL